MARTNTLLVALVSLVLLGLLIAAAISIHRVKLLSLPISSATGIATLLLPILTGISLQGGSLAVRHSSDTFLAKRSSLPWSAVTIFIVLTIYETVIVTLSLTHMVPPSDLTCHLDRPWGQMFSRKNTEAIKRIQDAHNCCGLHSVKNMAWPFPAKGRPATACATTFGRDRSCFGSWRRDEQISAGLFLFVALGTFLVKISPLLFIRPPTPWSQYHQYATASEASDDTIPAPNSPRRIEPQYHDDDASDVGEGASNTNSRAIAADNDNPTENVLSPALMPSARREQEGRNEWA